MTTTPMPGHSGSLELVQIRVQLEQADKARKRRDALLIELAAAGVTKTELARLSGLHPVTVQRLTRNEQ